MKKAMNKVLTTLAMAAIALLTMVGCGQIERPGTNTNNMINVTYGEGDFAYCKDTSDEVYTGYTKAKKTIETMLGSEVEIGQEYPAGSYLIKGMLKPVKTNQMSEYMLFRVPDYDSSRPTVIIFLYNDDNNGVIASDVQKDYYDEENDKLDLGFESQLVNGVYACRNDATSDCYVSEAAGPVSTVWEYDESTRTISLVWENWARF